MSTRFGEVMETYVSEEDTDAPYTQEEDGRVVLWVKAASSPHRVSGSILKNIQEGHTVSARAIGAGAVNQALKGCAIARQVCAKENRDLFVMPAFESINIEGQQRTAMSLHVTVV